MPSRDIAIWQLINLDTFMSQLRESEHWIP
jgi:hypothetical protein